MHWGLIPHWAAEPSIGNRMINARAETLTELPSFKLLVDRRRCIIPADGFYEWRTEGKRKGPALVPRIKQGQGALGSMVPQRLVYAFVPTPLKPADHAGRPQAASHNPP
jgi:SOS response associated peptidase (SRAP)